MFRHAYEVFDFSRFVSQWARGPSVIERATAVATIDKLRMMSARRAKKLIFTNLGKNSWF